MQETADVRKEAMMILDSFGKSLGKVKVNVKEAEFDGLTVRVEGSGFYDSSFREAMFANMPRKEGDFLIAEKARWNNGS